MSYELLQQYWWLLISVLGALLVFLLFVQGGQSMIFQMKENQREDMVYSIAHRWELTFTVLVTFGGAFFASFPLFYSTSFGGAYWVWMLILFGFIVQAVSYKYRLEEGNILGRKVYDCFLFLNGILAPVLLGGAVSTFFFGSDFTVEKTNLIINGELPTISSKFGGAISQWGALHGLEVLADWRVVAFGVMVLFLTRVLANLWFINQVDKEEVIAWNRKQLMLNAPVFVVLFLVVVGALLMADGYQTVGLHEFEVVPNKYFHNLFGSVVTLAFFLIGTILVLLGVICTVFPVGKLKGFRSGIWSAGIGTVMVVLALFWIAGYFDTPYYPSNADIDSSLTIYNSSSSQFTLETMSYVSLAIPFVLAYIAWVWKKITKKA